MLPELGSKLESSVFAYVHSSVISQYAGINEPKWVYLQHFLNM